MATIGSAFGFVPQSTTDGADYHGKMRDVILDTSTNSLPIFQGDMLASITGEATDTKGRVEQADEASATDLVGAVVEIYPDLRDEGTLMTNYLAAGSDDRDGRVVYGSDVIYAVREDAVGGAFTGANIGEGADMVSPTGLGDAITGMSGMALDSSVAPSAAGQFLLHSLGLQAGNAFSTSGDDVGAVWFVTINPAAT